MEIAIGVVGVTVGPMILFAGAVTENAGAVFAGVITTVCGGALLLMRLV